MILPKKDEAPKNGQVPQQAKPIGVKLPPSTSTPDIKKLQIGVKFDTQTYTCTEKFKCPPVELYNVLTVTELLRAFTGTTVQNQPAVGGKFSLFDGQIVGEYTELVRCSRILIIDILTMRATVYLGSQQKNYKEMAFQNLARRPLFDCYNHAKG